MKSDSAPAGSGPPLAALCSLFQIDDQLCQTLQRQVQHNEDVRKRIGTESRGRTLLSTFLTSLSDQNMMLRDTLNLIEEPANALAAKQRKLMDKKKTMQQVNEKLEKRAADLQAKKQQVTDAIRHLNQDRQQLVADAVSEVTAQFAKQLEELDAQMKEDSEKRDQVQKEMEQLDGMQRAKSAGMRQQYEQECNKKRQEFVKKMARLENEMEKLDPQHEGEKAAARRESDQTIAKLQETLQQKRDQRNRLQEAANMLPEPGRRSVPLFEYFVLSDDSDFVSRKASGGRMKEVTPDPDKRKLSPGLRASSVSPASKKGKPLDALSFYRSMSNGRK